MHKLLLTIGLLVFQVLSAQETPYEKSNKTRTATYDECVGWYQTFCNKYPQFKLTTIGQGDIGKSIYACNFIGTEPIENKVKILINNNIHPGEPEGTDASMLLLRNLAAEPRWRPYLKFLDITIICQYNVDGTCNRNCCSRANQNGPEEVGFRGNAKNLDLNRDFIKIDSRNAESLVKLIANNNYHILVDNHTSNGADYQYTLTSFVTRPEKLHQSLRGIANKLDSAVCASLANKNWPNVPYINTRGETPESGLVAFWESGRYATGFAALHNCIGFTVETHMLKPFPSRVDATLAYLNQMLMSCVAEKDNIINAYKLSLESRNFPNTIYPNWSLDTNSYRLIDFMGYQAGYKKSEVTGMPRLYYDRKKPQTIKVKYFNKYVPSDSIKLPNAYIIPQAYSEVIKRLYLNGVKMTTIQKDTLIYVGAEYINGYKTVPNPYESHYMHYDILTRDTQMWRMVYAGDAVVSTFQTKAQFIGLALEPSSPDSYFAWNSFDGILMQKEHFSSYVFEDLAADILRKDAKLQQEFEQAKAQNPELRINARAQLDFIYKRSSYYEPTHNLYPITYVR
jgi:hypothetical protein